MSDDSTTKQCTTCKHDFPATTEYFYKKKSGKYGIMARCKKCISDICKRRYEANREHVIETNKKYRKANPGYAKQYAANNKDRIRKWNRQWRENNREYISEYRKQYYEANREQRKQYLVANRDRIAEYSKQYRKDNHNRIIEISRQYNSVNRERAKQYREDNRERIVDSEKQYRKTHKGKLMAKIRNQRREARKLSLPDTLTASDWQHALNYFNGRCAVCERPLNDLFETHKTHFDHWIPLNHDTCPGTIPKNIVPLCGGVDGCNNRKQSQLPKGWLVDTFGQRKAKVILKRIEDYFASL